MHSEVTCASSQGRPVIELVLRDATINAESRVKAAILHCRQSVNKAWPIWRQALSKFCPCSSDTRSDELCDSLPHMST